MDPGVVKVSAGNENGYITHCGREFTHDELATIRAVLEMFPGLTRKELARTLCENLGWFTASGSYKIDACLNLLDRLSVRDELELLEKFRPGVQQKRRSQGRHRAEELPSPVEPVCGSLKDLGAVSLDVVSKAKDKRAWKEAVEHHHYLGYKRAFGCRLSWYNASSGTRSSADS